MLRLDHYDVLLLRCQLVLFSHLLLLRDFEDSAVGDLEDGCAGGLEHGATGNFEHCAVGRRQAGARVARHDGRRRRGLRLDVGYILGGVLSIPNDTNRTSLR